MFYEVVRGPVRWGGSTGGPSTAVPAGEPRGHDGAEEAGDSEGDGVKEEGVAKKTRAKRNTGAL